MSIKIMSAVWECQLEFTSCQRLVLLALADHANDDGTCWPGLGRISRKCGLSRRYVNRIVAVLVNNGALCRTTRFRDDGSQTSNVYSFSGLIMTCPTCPCPADQPPPDTQTNPPLVHRPTLEPSVEPPVNQEKAAPNVAAKEKKQKPLLPPPPELADLRLYAIDQKLIKRWPEAFARWQRDYPQLNVLDVVRDAHGWECDNPAKRKTDRVRFLGGWLRRKAADEPVVEPGPYGKGDA